MTTMGMAGAVTIDEGDDAVAATVEANLLAALRRAPQGTNTAFTLAARDGDGGLVGGLSATTAYGWLLVKTLWVDDAARGQGIGRALMARAEARARDLGCHGAWLDTSSASARGFYERLGYAAFGRLVNNGDAVPAGHRRWFMQKPL